MSAVHQFLFRLRGLFRRKQLDADMAEEMRLHLEERTRRNLAAGMMPDDARHAAQRSFGGTEQIKERARDQRGWHWLTEAGRDVRYALRSLGRAPGFSVVALATLALGIGVTATMFSIARDIFLRPLLRDHRLNLASIYTGGEEPGRGFRAFSHAEFTRMRAAPEVFSDVAAMGFASVALGQGDDSKRSVISFVSENYFSLLDVRPASGRFFSADEARPNANVMVAVASHSFWQRLGAPRDFVGQAIKINGLEFAIIGIAPEGFGGLHSAITPAVWVPLGVASQLAGFMGTGESRDLLHPRSYRLFLIARLLPDLTLGTARLRLPAIETQLSGTASAPEKRRLFLTRPSRFNFGGVQPDDPVLTAFAGRVALMTAGIAGAVMLVACLNVANLLLARGANRRREIAIRLSIGASRGRVVRQLVVEGLVLGLAAGGLGVGLSAWTGLVMQRWFVEVFSAGTFAFNPQRPVDGGLLAATVAVSLVATLVFSVVPALRATRVDLVSDLKQQAAEPPAAGSWNRFFSLGSCLVMGQIALALALLFGAGLFRRAAEAFARLDHGFRLDARLVANIDYDFGRTPVREVPGRQRALLERIRATPGVSQAALASAVPYNFERHERSVYAVGREVPGTTLGRSSVYTAVSRDYFQTLGIPLRGRDFNATETSGAAGNAVAIIDETLGRRLFGDDDPLGRHITLSQAAATGEDPRNEIEIIGIIRSPREEVFEETAPPRLYRPLGQVIATNTYLHVSYEPARPAAVMIERIRRELQAVEPDNPVILAQPLADFPGRNINTAGIEFGAALVTTCGLVTLILALVGVYSVKAYAVARRTREIGIRVALGARAADVYRLILSQAAGQVLVGVVGGTVLALIAGRTAAHLLYRIDPYDWGLLAAAVVLLSGAVMLACLVPARRAAKVDPMIALRCE